jgi:transcriptional regulator with XRE-family HTH domain
MQFFWYTVCIKERLLKMNALEFGKYIKNLRLKAGYSDRESLSKSSGIWNSTIKRIEEGITKTPSIDILKKLAPALKVSSEELMEAAGYIEEKLKLGEFIKQARENKRFSLEDFSKMVNLSTDQIKKIEGDELSETVTLKTWLNIAEKLDISRQDIFGILLTNGIVSKMMLEELYKEEKIMSSTELKLVERFRKLSPSSQQTVLELINSLEIIEETKKEHTVLSETEVS